MQKTDHIDNLRTLFAKWANEEGIDVQQLPQSGGYRQYYRLRGHQSQAIGVFSPDRKETEAFISFTKHFGQMGLHVPEIYITDETTNCYLITDLGEVSLLDHLERNKRDKKISDETIELYRQVVAELPRFQVDACKSIDFSLCYPSAEFDGRSMRWDLNYFKYYFLKLMKIQFDEAALEDDFDRLILYLLRSDSNYFMYRDFQARNIMVYEGKPWYIDYQGGRRGPLQYDLASLLFQAKADLPDEFRNEMLEWYLQNLKKYITVDDIIFREHYYAFVLIRLLQVMGAYGYRGYFEHRAHFLQSIPYSLKSLTWWLGHVKLPFEMPELIQALKAIASTGINTQQTNTVGILTVEVNSFSFKGSPPPDYSGNGGGFVFDCRALPNPGRYDHFKKFTGLDEPVKQYLNREPLVGKFMQTVIKLIEQSMADYQRRGFSHLQVNFGCTGGQHRSVYCAEQLAAHLDENYSVQVVINHSQLRESGFLK